jgi:hypothetical protein
MRLPWKRRPPVDELRRQQLVEAIRTARMLEEWREQPSYQWLMQQARAQMEFHISKRDAAAADGVLQLTNSIARAIASQDSALVELEMLRAEQGDYASETPPADNEQETPARTTPQPT